MALSSGAFLVVVVAARASLCRRVFAWKQFSEIQFPLFEIALGQQHS